MKGWLLIPKGLATHRLRTTDLADELLAYRWRFVCDTVCVTEITLDCVGSHVLPETPTMAYPIAHAPSHLSTQSSTDLSLQNSSSSSKVCRLSRHFLSLDFYMLLPGPTSQVSSRTVTESRHLIHTFGNDLLCWVCTGCYHCYTDKVF